VRNVLPGLQLLVGVEGSGPAHKAHSRRHSSDAQPPSHPPMQTRLMAAMCTHTRTLRVCTDRWRPGMRLRASTLVPVSTVPYLHPPTAGEHNSDNFK
jgi:hypothetical protein